LSCFTLVHQVSFIFRQQAGAAAHLGLAVNLDEDASNTMEYIDNALLNENTQPEQSQSALDFDQPTRAPSVPKAAAAASTVGSYSRPTNRTALSSVPSPRNVPISPAVTSAQPRIGTPVSSEPVTLFRSPSPAQQPPPSVLLEGGISTEDLNLTPRGQSPSEEGFASKGILKR
jgi:hypothetical protein